MDGHTHTHTDRRYWIIYKIESYIKKKAKTNVWILQDLYTDIGGYKKGNNKSTMNVNGSPNAKGSCQSMHQLLCYKTLNIVNKYNVTKR